MIVKELENQKITVPQGVFVAENAVLAGKVTLSEGNSIWYGAVLRADEDSITLGKNTNVQDNATVHTTKGFPVVLGEGVTVGHNAIVHGAKVGNNTMIGMGAVVMNGAEIGENCIVAAGALVTEKTKVPDGMLLVGVPAKILKPTSPEQIEGNRKNAETYVRLGKEYQK